MYTVIKTGGKQFKVDRGDVIKVEVIPGNVGELVTFNDILAVGEGEEINIGAPYVDGAEVVGKILRQAKDKKVIVFKKKRRKGYSRKTGHRQRFTEVLIEEIKSKKRVTETSPEDKSEDVKKEPLKAKEESGEKKKLEKKVEKKATKAVTADPSSKKTSASESSEEKKAKAKKETE